MKRIYYTPIFFVWVHEAFEQQGIKDGRTFLSHKFGQNIGKEKYTSLNKTGVVISIVDFKYVDRDSPVFLKATMKIISGVEPISYGIKGGTSRFSSVNDSIVIENKTALLLIENSFYN